MSATVKAATAVTVEGAPVLTAEACTVIIFGATGEDDGQDAFPLGGHGAHGTRCGRIEACEWTC